MVHYTEMVHTMRGTLLLICNMHSVYDNTFFFGKHHGTLHWNDAYNDRYITTSLCYTVYTNND